MKIYANGDINKYVSVAANPLYPGYVIKGGLKNLMVDAGINYFGPLYIKSLEKILGSKDNLHYLFITHSHYDHLGSMPYLKRMVKDIKIGGAERISALLKKESVLKRMNELSEVEREIFKDITGNEDVRIEPVELDYSLKEGDSFNLGELTCEVYEVPGHTRDSLAFFVPEIKALFPGEAAGVPQSMESDYIQAEFLSSYSEYLHSLEKIITLKPKMIGVGHGFILTDKDATDFLQRSYTATFDYKKLIEDYLDRENGDIEKTIDTMLKKEYDEKGEIKQVRNAYIANLTAQVREIASLQPDSTK